MLPVPEFRANGSFLIHVGMIEALGGHIALVLDDGAVRAFQVSESRAKCRLNRFGLGFRKFGRGAPQRVFAPGDVSLLTYMKPPSSVVYNGSRWTCFGLG